MSRLNHKKDLTARDYLTRIGIILAATALILYFLPREKSFSYQFHEGAPWRYGQLIAPYDFPILKDEATVQMERDSILRLFEPYYTLNEGLEQQKLLQFRADVRQSSRTIPYAYIQYVHQTLHRIYSEGIVSTDRLKAMKADSIKHIRVVSNNQASERPIEQLHSQREAYKILMNPSESHINISVLQGLNLNDYLEPNLTYDSEKSEAGRRELLGNISLASGMVVSGQNIVDRGDLITPHIYNILTSLQKEEEEQNITTTHQRVLLAGQAILVLMLITSFMIFLWMFRKDYFDTPRSILLMFMLIILFPILTSLVIELNFYSVYIIPYAMLPLFLRVFLDSRTASMAHATSILISSLAIAAPAEFIFLEILVGFIAIYTLRDLSQRSDLIRSAVIITVCSIICYFAMDLLRENDLKKLDWGIYTYLIVNGVLMLFAYPLMYVIEKLFGFTSNVTLVELSNVNNELLRRMSEVAPGTFQHSMQVANLAAEVANKIGAQSQLVRTGALYHDVGKIEHPAFFTENQSGINPHNRLNAMSSAQVIISHVNTGLALAEKFNLPKQIKDFITTHHGSGKTRYFYITYCNEHPGEPVDEAPFTYPGPNPSTREQAILMMADAVEATSHSLKEITEESLKDMVSRIIDTQVNEGFFHDCPITFQDIVTAKAVLTDKLRTIYHTRIVYPELKK